MEVTLGPRPTFCKLGRACAMGTSRMHRWNIFESKFAWAVAAACSALAGCSSEAPPAPPTAPEVGVITVRPQNIPNIIELPGRVQAIRTAEVRARVDGIVQRRLYEEGTDVRAGQRSEEHTSELQSLMRISYAVFCLKKNKTTQQSLSTNNSIQLIK